MANTVVATRKGRVGIVTIDRPEALNAINADVMEGLLAAIAGFDRDEDIGCIVLTGSGKAFIAGADIREMADKSFLDMYVADTQSAWETLAATRTPMIAAVNGFALGGGCEIAMICDFIIAAQSAKFGQPEIKLGVIPGWGGTQRLTRAVGKARAMDLILTGRMMDSAEALACGLVARVVPDDALMEETLSAAQTIAGHSRPSVLAAKESVGRAFETSLAEGIRFERRLFHALFSTEDQKEGMKAFAEKRKPGFRHR